MCGVYRSVSDYQTHYMKLLHQTHERAWYLVKEWTTEAGLSARIQKCVWNDEVKALVPSLTDHYTGYVQKRSDDTKVYYDSEVDVHGGVTFEDTLEDASGVWAGFDMAHLGDENISEPLKYAERECENLAKQMTQV
jgi:hypothetical protein